MLKEIHNRTKRNYVLDRVKTLLSGQAMNLLEMRLLLTQLESGDLEDDSDELANQVRLQMSKEARIMRVFITALQTHGRRQGAYYWNYAVGKADWLDRLEQDTGIPTSLPEPV